MLRLSIGCEDKFKQAELSYKLGPDGLFILAPLVFWWTSNSSLVPLAQRSCSHLPLPSELNNTPPSPSPTLLNPSLTPPSPILPPPSSASFPLPPPFPKCLPTSHPAMIPIPLDWGSKMDTKFGLWPPYWEFWPSFIKIPFLG